MYHPYGAYAFERVMLKSWKSWLPFRREGMSPTDFSWLPRYFFLMLQRVI